MTYELSLSGPRGFKTLRRHDGKRSSQGRQVCGTGTYRLNFMTDIAGKLDFPFAGFNIFLSSFACNRG